MEVFRSEVWAGSLCISEFQLLLRKLGLDAQALGRPLFAVFDPNERGDLDLGVFIGLAILLSTSHEARLWCVFDMLDANGAAQAPRA